VTEKLGPAKSGEKCTPLGKKGRILFHRSDRIHAHWVYCQPMKTPKPMTNQSKLKYLALSGGNFPSANKMTRTRVCSKGRRCRAIRLAQSLTDDNFRRPAGRSGFFKTCNLCRNTSVHIAPNNNHSTSQSRQPQYCPTCHLPRDSQYLRPGFPYVLTVFEGDNLCAFCRQDIFSQPNQPSPIQPTQPNQPNLSSTRTPTATKLSMGDNGEDQSACVGLIKIRAEIERLISLIV
jgi:hypothetical protein